MVKFVTNYTVVQFCYILYMHYSQEALLKIPGKCKAVQNKKLESLTREVKCF
jgi:hypothetical protein